jgi:hypothetical protein
MLSKEQEIDRLIDINKFFSTKRISFSNSVLLHLVAIELNQAGVTSDDLLKTFYPMEI